MLVTPDLPLFSTSFSFTEAHEELSACGLRQAVGFACFIERNRLVSPPTPIAVNESDEPELVKLGDARGDG